jgi:hypothetical protein
MCTGIRIEEDDDVDVDVVEGRWYLWTFISRAAWTLRQACSGKNPLKEFRGWNREESSSLVINGAVPIATTGISTPLDNVTVVLVTTLVEAIVVPVGLPDLGTGLC